MIDVLNEYALMNILSFVLTTIGIILTVAVYWYTQRGSWAHWKMENVYDDIVDELRQVYEEETLPGEAGDRVDHSEVMELSSLSVGALGMEMSQEVRRYRQALRDIESAEETLLNVVPHLEEYFPEVLCDRSGTSFQVVVGGWTGEQLGTESSDADGPTLSKFVSYRPFELLFSGMDLGVFDVESPGDVRPYFEPDAEEPDQIDLNEPVVMLEHDNLTHRSIAFWDENIPDWEERIFHLIDQGHVEMYLRAKKVEQDSTERLSESANTLLREIATELSETTGITVSEIDSVRS